MTCNFTSLQSPAMLVDKTNFGLVLYNHANFYLFEETSSYWSVKRIISFSLLFIGQRSTSDAPPASQYINVQ